MTKPELLDYEIGASSWWCGWISNHWLQARAAAYFARKVNRKWAAYQRYLERRELVRSWGLRASGHDGHYVGVGGSVDKSAVFKNINLSRSTSHKSDAADPYPEIPERYARHLRAGAARDVRMVDGKPMCIPTIDDDNVAPLGINHEISTSKPRQGMRTDKFAPIALDLTVANAERKVVEAAIQWLKANTAGMTPETWAAVDDDCENKTELLYRAVSALISAREKAEQSSIPKSPA